MQKPEEYNNPLFWKWEKEHIFGPFWDTFALILGKNSTKVNIDNFWVVTEFYIYTKNQSIPSILRNRLNGHFWAHFDTFCSSFEQTRVSDKSKLATFFVKSWSLTFMKKKLEKSKEQILRKDKMVTLGSILTHFVLILREQQFFSKITWNTGSNERFLRKSCHICMHRCDFTSPPKNRGSQIRK